jgi:hypothetical protein
MLDSSIDSSQWVLEYDLLLLLPGLAGDEKPSNIPCVFHVDSLELGVVSLELGVVSLSGDDSLS